jgi:hypothetical protein
MKFGSTESILVRVEGFLVMGMKLSTVYNGLMRNAPNCG